MNEFTCLAEVDQAHEDARDPVSLAVWLAGAPCSPLHKRHSFPDKELAALVAATIPDQAIGLFPVPVYGNRKHQASSRLGVRFQI